MCVVAKRQMQGRAATLFLLCGGFLIYLNAAKIFSHIVCPWSFTMTDNVRHICKGTAFENRQPNIFTKVDSSTDAQLLPSAVLLQICLLCGRAFYFFINFTILSVSSINI